MALGDAVRRALRRALSLYGAGSDVADAIDASTSLLGATAGTVEASKAVVVDANKDIGDLRDATVRKLLRTAVQTIDMNDATVTLTAATVTSDVLFVDPNGNNEDLKLPPEADMTGGVLHIFNTGGESIVVKDDTGNDTICTITTGDHGIVACDGTTWHGGLLANP